MKNFITKGNTFEYTVSGSDVSSGDLIEMGDVFGVAATDGKVGETIAVNVQGVFELPKANVAVTQGAKLYNDAGTLTTDDDEGANKFVGHAYQAADIGNATVLVKLNF